MGNYSSGTKSDRIKDALACPKKGTQPTGTAKSVPRGKNFMPKGMSRSGK